MSYYLFYKCIFSYIDFILKSLIFSKRGRDGALCRFIVWKPSE